MATRRWNADRAKPGRCGHNWCTDCATRRGRNVGNRRIRQAGRRIIKRIMEGKEDA